MDIFSKCGEFTAADDVRRAGLYPYFIALTNNEGTEAVIGDHHLIMIGSNNYLGLANHPDLRAAAETALTLAMLGCNLHSHCRHNGLSSQVFRQPAADDAATQAVVNAWAELGGLRDMLVALESGETK